MTTRTQRTVPPHLRDLFDTIRYAIAHRHQVVLMYGGLRREVCPHSLGWKGDTLSCFAYQFGGESRQPLPRGGQWRCLHLHSMSEVIVREGDWHTGPIDPQRSSCVDQFEAYVGYPEAIPGGFDDSATDPVLGDAYSPLVSALESVIGWRIDEALAPLHRRIEALERELRANRGAPEESAPDER